jgi:hypothetical protein
MTGLRSQRSMKRGSTPTPVCVGHPHRDSASRSIRNTEELRPEKPHRLCIPRAARQLIRQPALALTRVVVREQMRSARVPVIPQPLTQFQTYARITLNVADLSRLHPMLCYQPELVSDTSIAHWRAPWLHTQRVMPAHCRD